MAAQPSGETISPYPMTEKKVSGKSIPVAVSSIDWAALLDELREFGRRCQQRRAAAIARNNGQSEGE
jgi:hypothetical protein